MGSHLTSRVEATEFFDAVHAGYFQIENALALLRRQAAHQVHELALVGRSQARLEGLGVLPQCSRQLIPLGLAALQLLAISPQGSHRGADSQGLAIAVGNQPTVRLNRDMPHATRITVSLD